MITGVTAKDAYVNSNNGLRVRSGAGTKYEILTVLQNRTKVKVLGTSGDWKKIVYGAEHAFVHGDYLIEETENVTGNYLGKWEITAYQWTGFPCANGSYPAVGYTIACNSLPFGTKVYIDGIGERVVEDRGGAYHPDKWIDLYLGDYDSCINFGIQYLDVYLIGE